MQQISAKKANFWNWFAKIYSKQAISNMEAYNKKIEITQKLFDPKMEILEVGCGTGSTAILHAPFVKKITAVDISKNMIEIAQKKAALQNINNINFSICSIEEIKEEHGLYDIIMAHSVLHLIEDKEYAIEKFYKLIKPGGYFISSTACVNEILPLMRHFLPLLHATGVFPYVKGFDSNNLKNSILSAGFEIEQAWQPSKKEAWFIVAKKAEA